MINFEEEMKAILESDPLGLLDVKPKASSAISADQRLVDSFEEITAFMQEHGREPAESRNISERKLYSRLKGLRENPEKAEALRELDTLGLLADVTFSEPVEINTIEDVLEEDALGLLGDDLVVEADVNDIFTLKNVPKSTYTTDHVALRKSCKEFDQFEPLFKQCQSDLSNGKKVQVPFKSERRQIRPETMFVLQGMLCYVAGVGKWEKRKSATDYDARLLCVFENGTESNMLLRSLSSALWKDKNSRQVIDADQLELFNEQERVAAEDEATGTIYVLRSLSDDPRIKELGDLYKIGFSSVPVEQRIQNAKQEPTYLMADVKVVTEFETYNLNPQKMELLLHTFFAKACLNLDVFDGSGNRHTPREWFVVPLHVIETAVELLINGEIVNYTYDCEQQAIVGR